ncbi:MAG: hypothetical protein M3361_17920, partial [Candidatus Tectomicrobia bacterium]|nr:hypothetical protein [Candidatus Tectomicrobia bacterium]
MKLANFVTLARKVIGGRPAQTAAETSSKTFLQRKGKRITIPSSDVNRMYRLQRERHVRIEYSGPTKIPCLGCGVPFLYIAEGKGRYPEYHSDACKQKAYRYCANRVKISFPPVGNEADLAMKEEQTMSKRLSAKRRFTLILAVVAVLGIMMLVSLPWGVAGEGESIA